MLAEQKQGGFFRLLALSVLPYTYCSMLDQGVWAEVKVGDEHLCLFAEHNALGVQASVYNVIAKTWIAPSEPVDDLEQGRSEPQLMPSNTSSVWGIWNCRPCDGRNHDPRSLDKIRRSSVSSIRFFKVPRLRY